MPGTERPTFFIVPHTHWEGAVFQTREQYLEMGLPIILRALALLKAWPEYRFVLDQMCYIRPFLERYPEQVADFRKYIAEGRLAIVGGTDVMLDGNMPGGESFVRQFLLTQTYLREALGLEATIGWQLDAFGHNAQMPQLLRQAGLRSFWLFRGVPNWETPSEFLWEGLDGTRIPAFWLQQTYGHLYGAPATLPEFTAFVEGRFRDLDPQSRPDCRVGLSGADVAPPHEHLPEMVAAYNRQPGAPLALRLATPGEYEAAVLGEGEWPVIRCELNPIFQGTYSSRIAVKQRTRELERLLTGAEKLGAVLAALGKPVDEAPIERAWEPMLFNQAHDLMSGVMTDHVYEDSLRGFDFSQRLATEELDGRLRRYAGMVATEGDGIPIVVANALGRPRTDAVTVRVSLAGLGARGVRLVSSADGEAVPVQVVACERQAGGCLIQADIAFVARSVPAMGHATYRLFAAPAPAGFGSTGPASGETEVLEGDHLRMECDTGTGAVTGLTLVRDGWSALSGPANVVVQEPDHGDFWEPYHGLDGASRVAMSEPHPLAPRGQGVYSDEQRGEDATVTRGPVFSEFSVEHAFAASGHFRTTVRVWSAIPRVEFRTEITNQDSYVRYRCAFPTTVAGGQRTDAIPFGALERRADIEFPAQDWVEYGDGEHGLALLNRGLPGHSVVENTILLSLFRSADIGGYGFGGGYEPGMGSATGLEIGSKLTFEYALVPHAGDWREAGVDRAAEEYAHPLLARTAGTHAGTLPPRWSFLSVSDHAVRLSALRTSADGAAVVRVYETEGRPAPGVHIRCAMPVARAENSDLLERPTGEAQVRDGVVVLDLGPFEIRTLRLHLGAGGPG